MRYERTQWGKKLTAVFMAVLKEDLGYEKKVES
jgi:hypothetical protein